LGLPSADAAVQREGDSKRWIVEQKEHLLTKFTIGRNAAEGAAQRPSALRHGCAGRKRRPPQAPSTGHRCLRTALHPHHKGPQARIEPCRRCVGRLEQVLWPAAQRNGLGWPYLESAPRTTAHSHPATGASTRLDCP